MNISSVLSAIAADAERGDIVFPTHTEIALRVQRMLDDPDCAIDALGKLIAAEPILAARVIGLANSVSYNPGGRAITELKGAISRLGFSALRALAASIVVRQMKEMSANAAHRALASRLWEHTANVAALARVIARRVTRQNPDAAFFAGIVHEVGSFYLIARAGSFPGLLDGDLEPWHGDAEAQVGRAVMRALEVPAHILEAMETRWSGYLAMPPRTLGDTLLLADQLSPIESPLDALDGMSCKGMVADLELMLGEATLSDILAESTEEVVSISAALKG